MAVRALKDAVVALVGMAGGADAIGPAVAGIEPGMVESCPCPTRRRMAECACCGESRSNMVGIVCLLILRFVAAITIGRQGRVVVVDVTIRTSNLGVKTRQRERSIVVIERCRRPPRGAVADIALLWDPRCRVVRVIRILVIRQMATHTGCVGQTVIPIRVTLRALQACMEASKRPTRSRVIESSRSPVGSAVAHFTLLRETRGNVIRVVCSLEILEMATDARGDGDVEVSIDVALRAL